MIFTGPFNLNEETPEKHSAIELWHIDMFEGGFGSRGNLLKLSGDKYFKKYGVMVTVKIHTPFSAYEAFNKGIYPELISYSAGFQLPYDRLKKIKKGNGLGSYKGEIFAEPWCSGGYVLIKRKSENTDGLILSLQEYTFPQLAMYFSNVKIPIKERIESKNAVYSFYRNKNYGLVGTQRDLFRLKDKGMELEIVPLSGFCDLYQYLSIISEREKYSESLAFLNWFCAETKSGELLNKVGMMPYDGYKSGKTSEVLDVFEKVKFKYTTDVFMPPDKLKKLKVLCDDCEQNIQSIKNIVKIIEIN